jgi:Zn finger protein HypA/HybF involved in hydrogenase expression
VLHTARCECRNCGVHTMASVGYKVAGTCPNCGSFDMVPVD